MGLIIHLSDSTTITTNPSAKTLICSVEEAIKTGADAISIHVNIGSDTEREMLRDFGAVAQSAMEWGVPLLAMIYPIGRWGTGGHRKGRKALWGMKIDETILEK